MATSSGKRLFVDDELVVSTLAYLAFREEISRHPIFLTYLTIARTIGRALYLLLWPPPRRVSVRVLRRLRSAGPPWADVNPVGRLETTDHRPWLPSGWQPRCPVNWQWIQYYVAALSGVTWYVQGHGPGS